MRAEAGLVLRADTGGARADGGDQFGLVLTAVVDGVRQSLAASGTDPDPDGLRALVAQAAADAGRVLGARDLSLLTSRVADQLWRLGPLQPLLGLPGLTDILVNGPDDVWVDQGEGLIRVDCALSSEEQVRMLAVRLAASAGRRLDEACPWVDARLPSGLRLHAVLPPVSPSGTVISLRILRRRPLGLAELERAGTLPPGWGRLLSEVVEARLSFLISGGTGAGKTTLLASMLSSVSSHERIVLVEDVGELNPQHRHVVRLEARRPNVEGTGTVDLADLVRQALRMRPDRIVVGECRGPEVRDLLAALNTGHEGGCGTVHANAAADVPARLQALGALASMAPGAVNVQAAAALDAVIHIERTRTGRRVVEIAAVDGLAGGEVVLRRALFYYLGSPAAAGRRAPGWPLLKARIEQGISRGAPRPDQRGGVEQ